MSLRFNSFVARRAVPFVATRCSREFITKALRSSIARIEGSPAWRFVACMRVAPLVSVTRSMR